MPTYVIYSLFICAIDFQASTGFGILAGSVAIKRNVVRPPAGQRTVNKNPVKPKQLPGSQAARGSFKKMVEEVMNSSTAQVGNVTPTREQPGTPGPISDSSVMDLADPANASAASIAAAMADELELIEETWPGKVCAFCNLGERSQLGQGEMLRLEVGQDFEAVRQSTHHSQERLASLAANAGVNNKCAAIGQAATSSASSNSKKPRLAVKSRRSSSFEASASCSELQEELNTVGYVDEPDLLAIVEPCGYFYAHR